MVSNPRPLPRLLGSAIITSISAQWRLSALFKNRFTSPTIDAVTDTGTRHNTSLNGTSLNYCESYSISAQKYYNILHKESSKQNCHKCRMYVEKFWTKFWPESQGSTCMWFIKFFAVRQAMYSEMLSCLTWRQWDQCLVATSFVTFHLITHDKVFQKNQCTINKKIRNDLYPHFKYKKRTTVQLHICRMKPSNYIVHNMCFDYVSKYAGSALQCINSNKK